MATQQQIPHVKLVLRDDSYTIFTQNNTTLVLCAKVFIADTANCNVSTSRLIVYADTIIFTGNPLTLPGKEIRFHCNKLQWASTGNQQAKGCNQLINLKGADGAQLKEASAGLGLENGKDGGSLTLHVHNMEMLGQSLHNNTLEVDVNGGLAGVYRKDSGIGSGFTSGLAGKPGTIRVLYGDKLSRLSAELLDMVKSKTESATDKFREMSVRILPQIEHEWQRLSLQDAAVIASAKAQAQGTLELMATLARITDGLDALLGGDDDEAKGSDEVTVRKDFNGLVERVQNVEDYSHLQGPAGELQRAIEEELGQVDATQETNKLGGIAKIQDRLRRCLELLSGSGQSKVPSTSAHAGLSANVNKIILVARKLRDDFQSQSLRNMRGDLSPHIAMISYTRDGKDNLDSNVPLVHPDQCAMALREADSHYFAAKLESARNIYTVLQEQLRFVPLLLKLIGGRSPKEIVPSDPASNNLAEAFYRMEHEENLSCWTFQTLQYLHIEVNSRIARLEAGSDLFGYAKDWVPRLSYKFYLENAQEQIERLKQYETSYWHFFDNYQDQMSAGSALSQAASTNVYRKQLIQDEITKALGIIAAKEKAIDDATIPLRTQKRELIKSIEKATRDVGGLHMPSLSTMLTAGMSLVACGVMTGATGGLAAVMLAGSAVAGVAAVGSEITDTMADDKNNRINTKYLITQLTSTTGDLKSVTEGALQVSANGTLQVGEGDSRKLAVTQVQLEAFIEQFKKSLDSSVSTQLSSAIDAFFKTVSQRNQDILAYTRAVVTLAEKRAQNILFDAQGRALADQQIKLSLGLPSVVAYYQRLRNDSRTSILRTIRQAALALRFWGLKHEAIQFSGPELLALTDAMQAHLNNLTEEQKAVLVSLSATYSPYQWPSSANTRGIMYRLTTEELAGLKIAQDDLTSSISPPLRHHTVCITGLENPDATDATGKTLFAGHANTRVSHVRLWVPGLKKRIQQEQQQQQQQHDVIEHPSTTKQHAERKVVEEPSLLSVNIEHGGREIILHPSGEKHVFIHHPVVVRFQYDMDKVKSLSQIKSQYITIKQSLPSDWKSANEHVMNQAAIGPFTTWTVSIKESENGVLDWDDVNGAYLEFCGSSMPRQ